MGRLKAIRARNGSRPQVSWIVDSKAECAALVDLLDRHPLRGRKLEQYRVWRSAVRLWGTRRYGLPPGAGLRLGELAAELAEVRAYRPLATQDELPAMDDRLAPFYFAGFFSGEGCFLLGPRDARFVIKVRRDDRPLLEAFRSAFGIGSVCNVETPEPWSPAVVWHVVAGADVLEGIKVFESAGLLGRKLRQFAAWRPGAEAVAQAKIVRGPLDANLVAASRRALAAVSAYRAPGVPLEPDRGYADARTAFLAVLRTWARLWKGHSVARATKKLAAASVVAKARHDRLRVRRLVRGAAVSRARGSRCSATVSCLAGLGPQCCRVNVTCVTPLGEEVASTS